MVGYSKSSGLAGEGGGLLWLSKASPSSIESSIPAMATVQGICQWVERMRSPS